MSIVRWDGLNKGIVLGPHYEMHRGQHYALVRAGTMAVYFTLDEFNRLLNDGVDFMEERTRAGQWPPPEPNR